MLTFVTGFFLVSPFLALGLYHLSRHRELGDNVNYTDSLLAFRIRKFDMVLLVTFHAIVMVAWICLVTLLGALYFGGTDASIAVLSDKVIPQRRRRWHADAVYHLW